MARYFFHLRDDLSADDTEGVELPNLEAAQERAEGYVADIAAAAVKEQRKLNLNHHIEVADEAGEALLTISVGHVVKVEG